MRKTALCLLLICVLAFPALAETSTTKLTRTTVLVYMAGSDLESEAGDATADLAEMANVPASGTLRVLAETGGAKRWQSEQIASDALSRFEVNQDGLTLLETREDASMGKAETLADFIAFGLAEAPADRYILVLWGHGSGATGGVCIDDRHWEDVLMPDELSQALAEGLNGARLDAVIFDACTMSCLEVAEALSPYADYMVASQALTSGTGLSYDQWLSELTENPEISTKDLCVRVAESYLKRQNMGVFSDPYNMSVLSLDGTEALSRAVNELYLVLDQRLKARADDVIERRAMLRSFGEFEDSEPSDFVDALRLADVFMDLEPRVCLKLRAALSRMVVYNETTNPLKGQAQGISVTMPYASGAWFDLIYDYYSPMYASSHYAHMIIDMAKAVEDRGVSVPSGQGGSLVPMEGIWTGLTNDAA